MNRDERRLGRTLLRACRLPAAILALIGTLGVPGRSGAGEPPDDLLERLLRSRPDCFATVLATPERFEVQVLYTQIDRDRHNRPRFTEHPYRVDREAYFYPASAVKLAGALLTLEKLHRLDVPGLDRDTPLRISRSSPDQDEVLRDETAPDGRPTLGHYIDRVFVVSDNDAYNRLYEFLGQERLNEGLREKGFRDARLTHRLAVDLTAEANRRTPSFAFYARDDTARIVYQQPAATCPRDYRSSTPIPKGVAEVVGGTPVHRPKDFAGSNWISLPVLQGLLRAALFPESLPRSARFDLTADDYAFLRRAMGRLPRESRHPVYDPAHFWDSYVKFLMFGDRKEPIPPRFRLFNKVGLAYGYMVDNAYVVDFDRGVEFLLTAAILVNEDGIYNDGLYEYEEIGFPFLANLGRVIYDYEVARPRVRPPDLSRFVMSYDD